jgi:hypothetical protein
VHRAGTALAQGAITSVTPLVTGQGSLIPPLPLSAGGSTSSTVNGPSITINQVVNPTPGMDENQVATISARRLLSALSTAGA